MSCYYKLDLTGGIAGDMFVASIVQAKPELKSGLLDTLSGLLPNYVKCSFQKGINGGIAGEHFIVSIIDNDVDKVHKHLHFSQIQIMLKNGNLPVSISDRAIKIFQHLAKAESEVHGVSVDDVHFHEISDWDSIADIVASAWLIEQLDKDVQWYCSPIPMGSGRVNTAHGWLPIPAPATAILLKEMLVFDDQVEGERVTPTGAAILRELQPNQIFPSNSVQIDNLGYGLGSKDLSGIPNVLRFTEYKFNDSILVNDRILVLTFNVDDQTPEELAIALDQIRLANGVLDVVQYTVLGKKGRAVFVVEVMAKLFCKNNLLDVIFVQTTTIGIRIQVIERKVLNRSSHEVEINDSVVRVKTVIRPGDIVTAKVESDDVLEDALSSRRDLCKVAEKYILKADDFNESK